MFAAACRSTKERNLFVVALVFSAFVWLAIVVSIVGLLYAPFVAIGVVVAHAFALARITGNSIRVGSRQLPDLYKRVENAASKLGLERMPEVYVMTGGGILNAFASKLFSRSFVVLNAEILDACETLDEGKGPAEPRAVDFIIGHELGHLALGHLSWNWLLWPAKLLPLLGPAYSRACEYSCDACGLAAADDVQAAGRALAVLSAGGRQARQINLDALVEQRHDTGAFIMGLVELNSTHPYLSKRVAAVQRVRDGGMAPDVGRNPFSYLLAPFFAGATTYLMIYVVVIAAVMASALPAMMKDLQGSFGPLAGSEGFAPVVAPVTIDEAPAAIDPAVALGALTGEAAGALTGQEANENDAQDQAQGDAPEAPRFEARAWLKGQLVAKNPAAVKNMGTAKALAFVEKLHKSGATKVWVSGVGVAPAGVYANELIAELPAKPPLRKKLVDLCTAEFAKQGYSEPCEDGGAEALWFYWE